MTSFENIFFLLTLSIAVIYSLLILYLSFSWIKIKPWKQKGTVFNTKVSIVIPVRNESYNIIKCLQSILSQDYPVDLFEIIICDDSSTDNTLFVIQEFILKQKKHHFHLLELSQKKLIFKKQAITEAVSVATGELIITTDGDCTMGPKWVSSIVSYYEEKKPVMIAGPVIFIHENGIFKHLQSIEFMSLVATGMGSISGNFPVMCNGANLAYSKEAFLSVGGYANNTKYASGDDIFLLFKIKKHFSAKIGILKSSEAIVYTSAPADFKEFLTQRLRWVSKSKGYRSFPAIFTSVIVYLTNLSIFTSGILSLFIPEAFRTFIILSIVKFTVDLPVLISITAFAKRKTLLFYYLPLQIIYVIYVTLIGIAGNLKANTWKGRKIS